VLKATVTAESVTPEIVAVNVMVESEFSSIDAALLANVIVGALSFSVIVIVTVCVPFSVASAPDTPLIAIIAVSFPS
jgi:hypothetical protein